jgi:hypothetical protein
MGASFAVRNSPLKNVCLKEYDITLFAKESQREASGSSACWARWLRQWGDIAIASEGLFSA